MPTAHRLMQRLLGLLHIPSHDADGWIYCAHPKCKAVSNRLREQLGLMPLGR